MKTILRTLMLPVVLFAAGCGQEGEPVPQEKLTIITPDDGHNQASGQEGAAFYEIDPCNSVRFQPGGYTIPVPENLGVDGPNSIHLIHTDDEYFRMPWDGTTAVTLGKDVLTNIKGASDFRGFMSGETYVLGVGHDNHPDRELKFSVMWVGMIKVR